MTLCGVQGSSVGGLVPGALETLSALVAAGADTSLTDPHGMTALGYMRLAAREIDDRVSVTCGLARQGTNPAVERLLMPAGGATEADEAARDLQPMQALKLYLESRGVDAQRQQKVIQKAEQLVEEEASEAG